MKILIVGEGDTGCHLAQMLSSEDQDIILMGRDSAKLAEIDSVYNLFTSVGEAVSPSDLLRNGVDSCDLFIAVTPSETVNLISCQIARKLGAKATVARIDTREYIETGMAGFFRSEGVDTLVFPEYLAAGEICASLDRSWARDWLPIHDGALIFTGIRIAKDSPLCGMELRDFPSGGKTFHVSAIKRGRETLIPRGDDVIKTGDIIYFTTSQQGASTLPALCGLRPQTIRRVIVAGGGKLTRELVRRSAGRHRLTVFDANIDNCRRLTALSADITVVNADPRNLGALRDEGLESADAFIALTENSESNIVLSMLAREFGVKMTIAEIEDMQYISEGENLSIDKIINKKLITSGMILRNLLDMDVDTPQCMALEGAEVAEIIAGEGARITRGPVKDQKLPREMTIAGLIHGGEGMLVNGNTVIEPGDHAVVVCLKGELRRIEKYFG